MSASKQLVRRCYDAWNSGDFAALERLLAPDVEIDATDRVMNPDRYSGVDGFRRLVAELSDVWDAWHIEAPDMVEHGDRLFVTHEVHARGKGSGVELVRTYWSVWTVHGGRVVKLSPARRARSGAGGGRPSGLSCGFGFPEAISALSYPPNR